MKEEVFMVTRGILENPHSTLLKLIEAESPRDEIDEAIAAIQAAKGDYSGIYFKNYFRVNRPIKLVDLSFYGPYEGSQSDYAVHVQVYRPTKPKKLFPDSNSPRLANRSCKISAKPREMFQVGFVEPVYIQPHVWHLIEFRLDGPPTLRCSDVLETATVRMPALENQSAPQRNVEFQFRLGSKQMPYLRFKLA